MGGAGEGGGGGGGGGGDAGGGGRGDRKRRKKGDFVDNVERQKWDLSEFKRRAEEEAERQAREEASAKRAKGAAVVRRALEARTRKVDLEKDVNTFKVVSSSAALSEQAGFYCEVCDCLLTDSGSYLSHINGRRHNQKLGMNMRVEVSTLADVKARLSASSSSSATSSSTPPSSSLTPAQRVAEMDARAERAREEKRRRRRERKEAAREGGAAAAAAATTPPFGPQPPPGGVPPPVRGGRVAPGMRAPPGIRVRRRPPAEAPA